MIESSLLATCVSLWWIHTIGTRFRFSIAKDVSHETPSCSEDPVLQRVISFLTRCVRFAHLVAF